MKNKMLIAIFSIITVFSPIAYADGFDWSACKSEIATWCLDAKNDEAIYSCLHSYDNELSAACNSKALTPYELSMSQSQ